MKVQVSWTVIGARFIFIHGDVPKAQRLVPSLLRASQRAAAKGHYVQSMNLKAHAHNVQRMIFDGAPINSAVWSLAANGRFRNG